MSRPPIGQAPKGRFGLFWSQVPGRRSCRTPLARAQAPAAASEKGASGQRPALMERCMRRTAASVSAKVVPPKWNPSTAMGPRREASMGSQGRLGRHGMGCGGVAEVGGRGAQDGRSETKNVRHRRHGSSGAPALTRPLAVALLKGVLEGSRLGGGARHAGRSCGVAAQRTVPPSDSSRSEHAVRSPPGVT